MFYVYGTKINPTTPDRDTMTINDRLREIISIHFDPDHGTPFWLEKERQIGLNVRDVVRCIDDLAILGVMDCNAMASRPVEDFIPVSMLGQRTNFIMAETGGTLGRPRFAAHRVDEFNDAFITPIDVAARVVGFPRGENWLFVGPSGPHIIGKSARESAKALGSPDPFAVDFDPRWAKKLVSESFAQKRYLAHIEDQALNIINTQQIGVIFSTPLVIESLGRKISNEKRNRISGLHLGGMPTSVAQREDFSKTFPNAVLFSGYGNSLFGVAPELAYTPECGIQYYPHGVRFVIHVIPQDDYESATRLSQKVPYGERGQIVAHRLDQTQFIANMIERDSAIRLPPIKSVQKDGFVLDGIGDPQFIVNERVKPTKGFY